MKYNYKEMPESMKGTYGEFSKNFGFERICYGNTDTDVSCYNI